MGEPKEIRPGRGGFHENPSTCMCEDAVTQVDRNSGPRKYGKDDAAMKNVSNDGFDVDDETEWPDMDDDEDQSDGQVMFNETISDYEILNSEEPELEEILSD